MKTLNTETKTTGIAQAQVYDHASGSRIGSAMADWDAYRAWAYGPSDVCRAGHCLSVSERARLDIPIEQAIFLID